MAAPAGLMHRIDRDLQANRAEADFLPQLAEAWDRETEATRFVWYSAWRDLMARLENLDRAYFSGLMTENQQACYRLLRERLGSVAPILARLSLPLPTSS